MKTLKPGTKVKFTRRAARYVCENLLDIFTTPGTDTIKHPEEARFWATLAYGPHNAKVVTVLNGTQISRVKYNNSFGGGEGYFHPIDLTVVHETRAKRKQVKRKSKRK